MVLLQDWASRLREEGEKVEKKKKKREESTKEEVLLKPLLRIKWATASKLLWPLEVDEFCKVMFPFILCART